MRQELGGTPEGAAADPEADLREQLAVSQLVMEHAADAVFLLDGEGETVYSNPAAERMFGWSKAELRGKKLHDVLHYRHPDGRPYPMGDCPLGRVFFSGTSLYSHEDTFFHKDGRPVPVACSNAPVVRDSVVEGGVLIVRDISETRAAQQTLAESEARLARALEAGELGAWELDIHTMAAWRSPQHDRIFGYETPLAEWNYDMFIDHVVPEDRDLVNASFAEAMASKGRWDFECRIRRSDGELRWIWAQGKVDAKADGQSQRIKGMVRDVTEHRRAQEALRELNDTLEQQVAERTAERNRVWEMSRDLLAIMGFDGNLKAINPAWETTFGRTREALLALSFREQVHPEDHPRVVELMEQLQRGETVERFEDRVRHADGSWRWISWTLVPEKDVFYAVGRDVTAEKEALAELERAQEALRQSQKMEAMGQLTGGVAHDFNNLLTPIVGSLDMLQRKGLGGPREQRLIDGAMQSADRAKTLVQRLLAFARRQPLQPSAVDVGKLVSGMADLIASTSGPQIQVVVEASDGLPPAKADPNQLEMALLNLGVNARDAMPDGGTLRITADLDRVDADHRSGLRPGSYVRLSVADTGVGMDEATLKRSVEPFFSTKGIGKGTGLGLSMVHGLASQLGGALNVESRVGVGTNIELWLPVTDSAVEEEGPAVSRSARTATAGTALLVDDEELVRESTADMLEDMGYAVVHAACAEEALRLIGEGLRPDVLITDHLMPGMNGTDLASAVRAGLPGTPVLIVSGYADVDGIAPDFPRLVKPFRNSDLADSLASLAPATTERE
jgi:PAS domain S-box-containing protein